MPFLLFNTLKYLDGSRNVVYKKIVILDKRVILEVFQQKLTNVNFYVQEGNNMISKKELEERIIRACENVI